MNSGTRYKDLKDIPIGPGYPIKEKLQWARVIFQQVGMQMKEDRVIAGLLADYDRKIDASWQAMWKNGVVEECTICAVQDGGSCCGQGIENKFDVVNLLVNLLFGVSLPDQPWDHTGCWFLGPKGCLLKARHVICVNFMCKRLYAAVPAERLQRVQMAMQAETDAAFMLEEYIKSWLIRYEKSKSEK